MSDLRTPAGLAPWRCLVLGRATLAHSASKGRARPLGALAKDAAPPAKGSGVVRRRMRSSPLLALRISVGRAPRTLSCDRAWLLVRTADPTTQSAMEGAHGH